LVWSQSNNEVIASGELLSQSELPQLSEYSKGRKVTVLVDSADVRLYRHYMPTKPSRQLLKALPFMLEDELAEDIDTLHFATGQTGFDKDQEQHWVDLAIVNKGLVQQWLSVLSEANISVKAMIPDVLCLPMVEDAQYTCLQLMELWLVREAEWQGSSLENTWFDVYCQQLALKEQDDSINVAALSPLPESVLQHFAANDQIEIQTQTPEMPMLVLAKGAEQVSWNLLQGDLAPKKAVSQNWMTWRPVLALSVLVVVLTLVSSFIDWQQNQSKLEVAQQELRQAYKKAFPKEKFRANIVRRQLQRKVTEATGGVDESGSSFLSYLQQLTPVFAQFDKVTIDSMRFDGNRSELRLAMTAPSFQRFEQFKTQVEQLDLEVKQGAVNNEGAVVTGSLSIKGAQ
jgi:general secretion pathway protein L